MQITNRVKRHIYEILFLVLNAFQAQTDNESSYSLIAVFFPEFHSKNISPHKL